VYSSGFLIVFEHIGPFLLLGSSGLSGVQVGSEGLDEGSVSLGDLLLLGGVADRLLGESVLLVGALDLGVWVESQSELGVGQRVLSVGVDRGKLVVLQSQDALDLIRVNDSAEIGVGDKRSGELVVVLVGGLLGVCSVDLVEAGESILGPDAETTNVTSGGQLEEVELCDIDALDSWNVSEGSPQSDTLGGGVDQQGSSSLCVTSVSGLSVSGADVARLGSLVDVIVGVDGLEEGSGVLCLGDVVEGLAVNDEGDLSNAGDAVTSGKDESWDG